MEKSLINRGQVIILILYKMDHNLYNYVCILKQYGIDITVFLIYHPQYANKEQSYMIEKLNARYIPSFMICTDNRLDKIMEASL
ncbi:hypothetical protein [Xylanivirga thermophila]|uniref:hypothetical protein n=1 Tax=Xylanivirga thermophila TaxID=2496273 RepID=UPI0039F61A0A